MGVDNANSEQVQQEAAGRDTPGSPDDGSAPTGETSPPKEDANLEEDAEAGHA
jgi:hypothetical protein